MAALPDVIRVVRKGNRFSLTLDGQHFPWLVELVETVMGEGRGPTLRLTLPAGRIEVIDEPAAPPTPINVDAGAPADPKET